MDAISGGLRNGRIEVFDADLSGYFDSIPDRELLVRYADDFVILSRPEQGRSCSRGSHGGWNGTASRRTRRKLGGLMCGPKGSSSMKYYTSTTEFNCGIDLHARQMYVCVLERADKKLVHTNVRHNDFAFFLKLVAPYRHDLTVCCECMFGWYWLADACQAAGLKFVLAHALYLKAIHGGKKQERPD